MKTVYVKYQKRAIFCDVINPLEARTLFFLS